MTTTHIMRNILNLEWLGVRFEKQQEVGDRTIFYYSVPESSTIELNNRELNGKIKTSDGLKLLAKEVLTDSIIIECKALYPDDNKEIKNTISEYVSFRAKVRVGEVWSEEMGDARIKELTKEIREAKVRTLIADGLAWQNKEKTKGMASTRTETPKTGRYASKPERGNNGFGSTGKF